MGGKVSSCMCVCNTRDIYQHTQFCSFYPSNPRFDQFLSNSLLSGMDPMDLK